VSAVDELRRADVAKRLADARVATLSEREAEAVAHVTALREVVDLAKAALRRASGSHAASEGSMADVATARAAFTAAQAELEAAEIAGEGIGDRLRTAELEQDMTERGRSLAAAEVAKERNAVVESRILAMVPELKSLLAQHRGYARFARAQATTANGTITEPIPFGANNSIFGGTAFALKLARDITPEGDAARDVARVEVNFTIADLL
jgi:hypothetical protein